jgi:hypothetical protein
LIGQDALSLDSPPANLTWYAIVYSWGYSTKTKNTNLTSQNVQPTVVYKNPNNSKNEKVWIQNFKVISPDEKVKITIGAGGCIAQTTSQDTIVVSANPSVPNISYQPATDRITTNNSGKNNRQWYFNGFPIPGATDGFYASPTPGDYQLEYTNAAGCKTISPVFTYTGVGIVNLGENTINFNMYPNPTNGLLNMEVNLANNNGPVVCNVYSMVGKLVHSQNLSGTASGYAISLSDLSNGVYMVELVSGGERGIQRLVIRR